MTDSFDVVVIGAGPAGEVCAGRLAAAGKRVAVVESELAGGECSYYGCIPSKALLRPAHVLAAARRVPGAAQAVTGSLDAPAAFARRDDVASDWDDRYQVQWITDTGAEFVRGFGRLSGTKTVDVERPDGSITRLVANDAVVIATGTAPAVPPVDGLRDIRTWDNRDITSAKEAPRRLIVLGGGAIGVEMAQAWKSLGSEEVTVVERAPRLLAAEEPFAGAALAAAFAEQGIDVRVGTSVVAVRREGTDGPVTATLDDGRELVGDEILVAVGRRPKTQGLGLESVGLHVNGWLATDGRLRALGDWLYAIGDVNGRALLTHMAKYQARIAADDILGRNVSIADDDVVPRVVFTDPAVAAVGLTEERARERGVDVVVVKRDLSDVAGATVSGVGISGGVQVVVDRRTDVIVGATFTGPDVGDLLHAATIAIVGRVPMHALVHAVPSFPTLSEVWLRLSETYEEETR